MRNLAAPRRHITIAAHPSHGLGQSPAESSHSLHRLAYSHGDHIGRGQPNVQSSQLNFSVDKNHCGSLKYRFLEPITEIHLSRSDEGQKPEMSLMIQMIHELYLEEY